MAREVSKPAKNEKVYAQQLASPPAIQTVSPDIQQHASGKAGAAKYTGRRAEKQRTANLFLYGQELAPFQHVAGGCRRFVEPVSPRLFIKTILQQIEELIQQRYGAKF